VELREARSRDAREVMVLIVVAEKYGGSERKLKREDTKEVEEE